MNSRQAGTSDLEAIMALERASFPTDAWSDAMMREELRSPHSWYVVLEVAGQVVGYAGLRAARGATDADIQTITIAEGSRGRGRGRALLTLLLEEASRRGIREVFLEVRADNPVAQSLYLSEGFAEVGRRPRYYQPDGVDALVMRLDLGGWSSRPGALPPPRDQAILPNQDVSEPHRPDAGASPELGAARPGAATAAATVLKNTDAGACT